MPTASVDIQLPDSQCSEIVQVMARYLRRFSAELDRIYSFDKEGALKGS